MRAQRRERRRARSSDWPRGSDQDAHCPLFAANGGSPQRTLHQGMALQSSRTCAENRGGVFHIISSGHYRLVPAVAGVPRASWARFSILFTYFACARVGKDGVGILQNASADPSFFVISFSSNLGTGVVVESSLHVSVVDNYQPQSQGMAGSSLQALTNESEGKEPRH